MFCAGYLERHKEKTTKQRNIRRVRARPGRQLSEEDFDPGDIHESEVKGLRAPGLFRALQPRGHSSPATSERVNDAFISKVEAFEQLHRYVLHSKVSQLKPPCQVADRRR